MSYLDGLGWKLWLQGFQAYLQISNAAAALQYFLGTVRHKAQTIWLAEDPVAAFTVEVGMLVLDITAEIPLPWLFIAYVAETLLQRVHMGFVGEFVAMFEHIATSNIVHVNLRRRYFVAPAA